MTFDSLIKDCFSPMNNSEKTALNTDTDTDLDIVNKDHQALHDTLERLRDMAAEDTDPVVIGTILGDLYEYTTEHFEREQDLMMACNYPHRAAHIETHQALKAQLDLLLNEQALTKDNNVCTSMLNFLEKQLIEHTQTLDRAFLLWKQKRSDPVEQTFCGRKDL